MNISTKKPKRSRVLTEAEIKEINNLLINDPSLTIDDLAIKYLVSRSTIYRHALNRLKHHLTPYTPPPPDDPPNETSPSSNS